MLTKQLFKKTNDNAVGLFIQKQRHRLKKSSKLACGDKSTSESQTRSHGQHLY